MLGCSEASDIEEVQGIIDNDSNQFSSGSAEYWYASPQTAQIHRKYASCIGIASESRNLAAFYSPACGSSLSSLSFDIPVTT